MRSTTIVTAVATIAATAVVAVAVLREIQFDENLETAPCVRFETYTIKNVPARCLRYFLTPDGDRP